MKVINQRQYLPLDDVRIIAYLCFFSGVILTFLLFKFS